MGYGKFGALHFGSNDLGNGASLLYASEQQRTLIGSRIWKIESAGTYIRLSELQKVPKSCLELVEFGPHAV